MASSSAESRNLVLVYELNSIPILYILTDVVVSEVIPLVHGHVQSCLSVNSDINVARAFELKPVLQFWSQVMEAIKDSYAVERMSEQLLHHLVVQNANDVEAYWILSILFHEACKQKLIWCVRFPVRFCDNEFYLLLPQPRSCLLS